MLKFFAFACLTAGLSTGCASKPDATAATNLLASNDFENLDGWLADVPARLTLTRDQAHSGRYSTLVSPGQEFSLGYNNELSRLAPDFPAKLTVSAWVWLPANVQITAKLVTEVKAPTNAAPNLLWEGLDLGSVVRARNKWQHVEQTIIMPAAIKPNNRLVVYLWCAGSQQSVYLDDLSISLASQ